MSGLTAEQIERLNDAASGWEEQGGLLGPYLAPVVAALIAEAVEEARKDIAQVVRNDALLWETLTADLALVASRNAPGWDAGEMAVVATRVIAARIARGEVSP